MIFFKNANSILIIYENFVGTIKSSNRVCQLDTNQGVYLSNSQVTNKFGCYYKVRVWYSDLESFQLPSDSVLLRMPYYRSWGANIAYKHERRAHKRRKLD
ncbi:hypothetical protein I3760_15G102300 [Carya illinoinensis]|nr:hypothetical protein I3760_15G102300 [Carya illinoinensis]